MGIDSFIILSIKTEVYHNQVTFSKSSGWGGQSQMLPPGYPTSSSAVNAFTKEEKPEHKYRIRWNMTRSSQ